MFTKKIHKRRGTFFETKGNSLKQTYVEGEEVHVKRTGTNRGGGGRGGGEGEREGEGREWWSKIGSFERT